MECPNCHKEHSAIAECCPHCGATLPAPPVEEVAAEAERLGIVAESASPPQAGMQRSVQKILVPIVTILVVAGGITTYFLKRETARKQKQAIEWVRQPVSPTGTLGREDTAYDTAMQYALTQGKLGLERDGISVLGSTADVWLKDPANGTRYRVSLADTGGGSSWIAISMQEAY